VVVVVVVRTGRGWSSRERGRKRVLRER